MKAIAALMGVLFAGFMVWLLLIAPIFGFHYETGKGTQVGYVSAVEKSGIFFKTGTAYIKPELESTQEDNYCVVDEAVYAQLAEAARNKQRVEVSHLSWFSSGVKNCNAEGAVITQVNPL